jgi:hypothetical protein
MSIWFLSLLEQHWEIHLDLNEHRDHHVGKENVCWNPALHSGTVPERVNSQTYYDFNFQVPLLGEGGRKITVTLNISTNNVPSEQSNRKQIVWNHLYVQPFLMKYDSYDWAMVENVYFAAYSKIPTQLPKLFSSKRGYKKTTMSWKRWRSKVFRSHPLPCSTC